jgi:triosephosphate isomerase (TIM)
LHKNLSASLTWAFDERTLHPYRETNVMRNIVTGNWKSNKLWDEAQNLMAEVTKAIETSEFTEVMVAPPAPYLAALQPHCTDEVSLASQHCSQNDAGAHTGEFTASMLSSIGVKAVLIGHSERRESFGETNDVVAAKVNRALESNLVAILCCGEQLEERDSGKHFEKVLNQVSHALNDVDAEAMKNVVIAYEPLWAIGTGRTASAEQAQEMHATVRKHIAELYGHAIASSTRILYGGSCKPSNALSIFMQPDVNGGLIGGAALSATDFLAIVNASNEAVSSAQ